MFTDPKETTSLSFYATIRKRSMEILSSHGMTLTQAFEEYMDELIFQGEPPTRSSREAKANTMRIRFNAFMDKASKATYDNTEE